eukprot:TRINITY_DN8379_c0_g1_i1.p2 TRINITY_DN8379_c0_g1~~TRINITY_DN8379_c0_g1_i1.p2  ORF type:complete len:601 (+),score=169.55 TRINITY_DN8379_c0_g1_i1:2185-3987(+)
MLPPPPPPLPPPPPDTPPPKSSAQESGETAAAAMVAADVVVGTASGAALGLTSAGAVSKMSLMAIVCTGGEAGGSLKQLPWSIHPTQLRIDGSPYAGCIVGSLLLLLGAALVHVAGTAALAKFKFGDTTKAGWLRACAFTRFPGLLVLIAAWLFLGIAFSAFHLLMAPGELPLSYISLACGAVAFFNCGLLLASLYVTHPRNLKAEYSPQVPNLQWWRKFFLGRRQWDSTDTFYVERYGLMFDAWRPPHQRWYAVMELGHMVPIAFYSAMMSQGWDACIVQNTSLGFVLLVYLLTLVAVRPHVSRFESFIFSADALLQFLSTVFRGVAFLKHDNKHWGFAAAAWCLVLALWIVTFWTIAQLVIVVLEMCGRLPPPPTSEESLLGSDDENGDGEKEDTPRASAADLPEMSQLLLSAGGGESGDLGSRTATRNNKDSFGGVMDLHSVFTALEHIAQRVDEDEPHPGASLSASRFRGSDVAGLRTPRRRHGGRGGQTPRTSDILARGSFRFSPSPEPPAGSTTGRTSARLTTGGILVSGAVRPTLHSMAARQSSSPPGFSLPRFDSGQELEELPSPSYSDQPRANSFRGGPPRRVVRKRRNPG